MLLREATLISVTVWLHTCADSMCLPCIQTSGKQRDEQELSQVVLAHYTNNASKLQMGFNSEFKGLSYITDATQT